MCRRRSTVRGDQHVNQWLPSSAYERRKGPRACVQKGAQGVTLEHELWGLESVLLFGQCPGGGPGQSWEEAGVCEA